MPISSLPPTTGLTIRRRTCGHGGQGGDTALVEAERTIETERAANDGADDGDEGTAMIGALDTIAETPPTTWPGVCIKLRALADADLGIDGDALGLLSVQQVLAFVENHAPAG